MAMPAGRSWRLHRSTATHSTGAWVATCLFGALTLAGCQKVADDGTPTATPAAVEAAAVEPAPSAGPPPLQSVPPRPQLSYTIQQQRQIVEALISDRENARYTSEVVRYRSGLSSLPPPPTPPAPPVVADLEPPAAEDTAPEPRLTDEETLADFLAALRRQLRGDESEPQPTPAEPDSSIDGSEADAAPEPPLEGWEETTGQVPVPAAKIEVADRLAASPDVVDAILDETVTQTPLPPEQSAVAARVVARNQIVAAEPPVPSLRPALARPTQTILPRPRPVSMPEPPPIKPDVAITAS
jgi:hypothetical protein